MSGAEDHSDVQPRRRRRTLKQPDALIGTISPAIGALAPAQDAYAGPVTPRSSCRRTTRSGQDRGTIRIGARRFNGVPIR